MIRTWRYGRRLTHTLVEVLAVDERLRQVRLVVPFAASTADATEQAVQLVLDNRPKGAPLRSV